MSLPSYLAVVQGARVHLGPDSGSEETFLVNPGLLPGNIGDYIQGGYVITNIMTRFKFISDAWVTSCNLLAAGYVAQCVFDLRQLSSTILSAGEGGPGQGLPYSQTVGAGIAGYTQFEFRVYTQAAGSSGRLLEAATTTSFEGCGWVIKVRGY